VSSRRSLKFIIIWSILAVLIMAAAVLAGSAIYIRQMLQPVPAAEEAVRIEIPGGSGSAQIARILERQGVIRDARIFSYYLKYKRQGARFQAGLYDMTPGMTLDAIIDMLNKGMVVKEKGIKLTVPEGFTVKQIADKAGAQFGLDPAVFIKASNQSAAFTADVFQHIPDDPRLGNRLEGYLFPETYEWEKDIKAEEMIDKMMLELDKKLSALPDGWQQAMALHGHTFHQMMTVASLIEREAALDEERPLISSVIHNRLKKGMALQIDATIQYLFDKPKERLFEKDLQLESPYNSYLHTGLPPGPIASPSLASIKAAIYPADTNYFFYVTKKDGSKAHSFAETFEQHQRNNAESKKNVQ